MARRDLSGRGGTAVTRRQADEFRHTIPSLAVQSLTTDPRLPAPAARRTAHWTDPSLVACWPAASPWECWPSSSWAALAVMTALAVLGRMRWLGHGLAVIGVAALVGLNLVAPAAFVAERNVERVIRPELVPPDGHAGLDAVDLGVLPDDAVPILVQALPALPEPERTDVRIMLEARRAELARDPAYAGPAAWNLGRVRAVEALGTLP